MIHPFQIGTLARAAPGIQSTLILWALKKIHVPDWDNAGRRWNNRCPKPFPGDHRPDWLYGVFPKPGIKNALRLFP
jgi:hypothetical protein